MTSENSQENKKKLEDPPYLERKEVDKMVEELMDQGKIRDSLIIETLFKTGMRASELVSVQKRDISPGENSKITIKSSKTKSGERIVHVPRKLASRLLHYANNNGKREYDEIFDMTTRNLYYIVRRSGKEILNKHIYPHKLRDSFAVHFLNETGNISKLQTLLGHSDINHTQLYLKWTVNDTREEYVSAFGDN